MKKIFKNIMLSAFVAALWSCAADEESLNLTVSPDYLEPVVAEGNIISISGEDKSDASFQVNASGEWTLTTSDSWFRCSPASGASGQTTVTIIANENPSALTAREGTITLASKSQALKYVVTISQTAAPEYIRFVGVPTNRLDAEGESVVVNVESNTNWSILLDEESQKWMSISPMSGSGNGTLSIVVDSKNAGELARTATVIVEGAATQKRDQMSLVQAPLGLPTIADIIITDQGRDFMTLATSFETKLDMSEILEVGFCYSLTEEIPTVTNSTFIEGERTQKTFRKKITGLDSPYTYFVRAYVRTDVGVGYSATTEVKIDGAIPDEEENVNPNF